MKSNKVEMANQKLENVLSYQNEVKAAVKTIADLEAAIEVQQAIVNDANGFKSGLPDLHTRREDLLAELISGGANKEELAALDEEIKVEKERLNNFELSAAQTVPDAKQALAGLRRKLDVEIAAFDTLKGRKFEVIAAFLKSEAERIGAEYLELATTLMGKYRELLAYGPLLREVDGDKMMKPWVDLTIPTFRGLEAHRGQDNPNVPGEMREGIKAKTNLNYIPEATKEEKARIAALGVEW